MKFKITKNSPSQKVRMFRSGFTLIELLVSLVIFVIFLGIVSTSYVSIVKAQRQANETRKMYSEVRSAVELLAEDVRLGTIDYDYYEAKSDLANENCQEGALSASISAGRTTILALVHKDSLERSFFCYDQTSETLWYKKFKRDPSGSTWIPAEGFAGTTETGASTQETNGYRALNSDLVKIHSMSFAIFPDRNPYSDDPDIYLKNGTQFQPKVSVFMSAVNGTRAGTEFTMDFQTTLSSRVYSRAS
ncbi:type II secretion system protein [Candidatus Peregrinibacteria bacterium]|nr:type II secretion system protein [Candidatus Peregrinibacteria bacterium]